MGWRDIATTLTMVKTRNRLVTSTTVILYACPSGLKPDIGRRASGAKTLRQKILAHWAAGEVMKAL